MDRTNGLDGFVKACTGGAMWGRGRPTEVFFVLLILLQKVFNFYYLPLLKIKIFIYPYFTSLKINNSHVIPTKINSILCYNFTILPLLKLKTII